MILNAIIGGFVDFFGDFRLQHKSISFTRWRHGLSLCDSDKEFGICIL